MLKDLQSLVRGYYRQFYIFFWQVADAIARGMGGFVRQFVGPAPVDQDITTERWILYQIILFGICELFPFSDARNVTNFISRKLMHVCSGYMMLHLDEDDPLARYFVYAVCASSLGMVWGLIPYSLRFAERRDVGITVYLLLVGAFFYLRWPVDVLMPVFFADPAGAVCGKLLNYYGIWNPKWFGEKTIGGSIAVFAVCKGTLQYGTYDQQMFISALVCLVEGFSLKFDNFFVAVVVVGTWYYHLLEPESRHKMVFNSLPEL